MSRGFSACRSPRGRFCHLCRAGPQRPVLCSAGAKRPGGSLLWLTVAIRWLFRLPCWLLLSPLALSACARRRTAPVISGLCAVRRSPASVSGRRLASATLRLCVAIVTGRRRSLLDAGPFLPGGVHRSRERDCSRQPLCRVTVWRMPARAARACEGWSRRRRVLRRCSARRSLRPHRGRADRDRPREPGRRGIRELRRDLPVAPLVRVRAGPGFLVAAACPRPEGPPDRRRAPCC